MEPEPVDNSEERPFTKSVIDMIMRSSSEDTEVDEEVIAGRLNEATREAAAKVVAELRRRAPEMLRDHREIRDGFEQRLAEVWGEAFDLFEMVQTCCYEAGETFNDRHRQAAFGAGNAKFEAMVLLHVRACGVSSEVQALLRSGHAAGAQARWRTLHEIAVVAFALGVADREVSERFLEHRLVEQYKDARQYQKHCTALGYEPFSNEDMQAMLESHDEMISRYGREFKNDWAWAKPLFPPTQNPSFVDLEKLVGMDHMRPWFRLSSHSVHGGASGAIHVRDLYGRGTVMLAGPSNSGLADAGHGALISLGQVTTAFLFHGADRPVELEELGPILAIQELTDEAGSAFLAAHQLVEEEDSAPIVPS
jgi:hypothetical protein